MSFPLFDVRLLYLILAVVVCVGAWKLLVWRFLRSDIDHLRPALKFLLTSGYHLGWVCFESTRTGHFVQFRKYIEPGNVIGIELAFPRSVYNTPYWERFLDLLDEAGEEVTIKAVPQGDDSMEFAYVDFGDDCERAFRVGRSILLNVYGLSLRARYDYTFDGIDLKLSEIVNKAQQPSEWPDFRRY
ncbi:MAG: hypothetical protein AB7S41_10710 [Parvibaculaceae bacterium]